ncbi:MAG: PQQ-binding-like beta-propeller repeat protein [Deltaproteobacteria bacterium]|nr:PQQ-binding-like beta-propeller repeat protein [Deltaproteobacteria bacterium]
MGISSSSSLRRLRYLSFLSLMGVAACAPAGTDPVGGSGGRTAGTGGAASGGSTGSGGSVTGSGGSIGSGGSDGTGGGVGTGGNGSGGAVASGGNGTGAVTGTGGGSASGGSTGSGGTTGTGGGSATGGRGGTTGSGGASTTTFAVVTNRYDNARSGSNLSETILNTTNVTPARFGLIVARPIVGYVYGQPLYVGGLTVGGVKRNVVYVGTNNNRIYAFDADSTTADPPIWTKQLGTPLTLGSGGYDPGCTDMRNEVGITATPVISLADSKIYVVAKTSTDQQLHALDLATGEEQAGSPVSVGKTAMPALDVRIHMARASLLLLNGVIYVTYGSHCDAGGYHGWIFGYDAKLLTMKSVYNTTPTGTRGAIWQSGMGPASDGTDIWFTVGNGTSGSGDNLGNNVVRVTPSGGGMTIAAKYQARVSGDNDLQSGAVLLGNSGQVVGGGKDGDILLLGQSDLSLKRQVAVGGEVNSFVYWNGSAGPTLFVWTSGNTLKNYQVGAGTLTLRSQNTERRPGHPSAIYTVSSNGTQPGTGIVWANVPLVGDAWHATATGALYAFDAADVSKPSLWNSTLASADNLGTYAKYSTPIVANGRVYVATFSNKLMVYGLK